MAICLRAADLKRALHIFQSGMELPTASAKSGSVTPHFGTSLMAEDPRLQVHTCLEQSTALADIGWKLAPDSRIGFSVLRFTLHLRISYWLFIRWSFSLSGVKGTSIIRAENLRRGKKLSSCCLGVAIATQCRPWLRAGNQTVGDLKCDVTKILFLKYCNFGLKF